MWPPTQAISAAAECESLINVAIFTSALHCICPLWLFAGSHFMFALTLNPVHTVCTAPPPPPLAWCTWSIPTVVSLKSPSVCPCECVCGGFAVMLRITSRQPAKNCHLPVQHYPSCQSCFIIVTFSYSSAEQRKVSNIVRQDKLFFMVCYVFPVVLYC